MYNKYVSEDSPLNYPFTLHVIEIIDAYQPGDGGDIDMYRFLLGNGQ